MWPKNQFLSRVRTATLTRDIDIAIMSVCLSVSKRLNISSFFLQHPNHPSFPGTVHRCEIPTGSHLLRRRRIQMGYINFAISSNIWLYVANNAR